MAAFAMGPATSLSSLHYPGVVLLRGIRSAHTHVVLYLFTARNSRMGATTGCFPRSPVSTSAEVEACELPAWGGRARIVSVARVYQNQRQRGSWGKRYRH